MSKPTGLIHLVQGAPLDMTYQHQIDFKSPSEQRAYWDSLVKYTLSDYMYIRRERRSIKVNKSFDDLEGINYLFYRSRTDTDSKWIYCFVTDRAYVNEGTTTLYFEIDVFQTYMFDFTFKPTYISQAHVDRWTPDHTPIYSRTEEGLNYGSEYVTESAYRMVPEAPDLLSSDGIPGFYLIYLSNVRDMDSFEFSTPLGTTKIMGNPIPYQLLLVPALPFSKGVHSAGFSQGDTVYLVSNIEEIINFMANSAFGQYVHQIVYIPYLSIKHWIRRASSSEGENGVTLVFGIEQQYTLEACQISRDDYYHINVCAIKEIKPSEIEDVTYASLDLFEGLEEKIPSETMWTTLKGAPRTTERDRRYESKLLCYPYRYNIFTDWTSAPSLIKNEYLTEDKITIRGTMGMGFNTPRRYWISGYRKDPEGRESSISQLIPLEQPVISDQYYTYMLENKNQIQANVTNATISAVAGGISSTVNGAVGGFANGGIGGAITGGLSSAISSGIQSGVNIANMMRSENAKQSDIKNLPDSISSKECTLAIADKNLFITIYRKAICCEFEEQLAQYWHMYGYKVNRMEVPNLRSRVRYNYLKTIGANITGPIESTYLQTLKAIFDQGITIWHYSESDFNPLDYTYENPEVLLL